jgi:hypothetical protein
VELNAYQVHVFLDFREVDDSDAAPYGRLAEELGGRGVPGIEHALSTLLLKPVHQAFEALFHADFLKRVHAVGWTRRNRISDDSLLPELREKLGHLLRQIRQTTHGPGDDAPLSGEIGSRLEILLHMRANGHRLPVSGTRKTASATMKIKRHLDSDPRHFGTLFAWGCMHLLGKMAGPRDWEEKGSLWMDDWHFGKRIAEVLGTLGASDADAWASVEEVQILIRHQRWHETDGSPAAAARVLETLLRDEAVRRRLGVNRYQDVWWFHGEAFDALTAWLLCIAAVDIAASSPKRNIAERIDRAWTVIRRLEKAKIKSGYRVEEIMGSVAEVQKTTRVKRASKRSKSR